MTKRKHCPECIRYRLVLEIVLTILGQDKPDLQRIRKAIQETLTVPKKDGEPA